MTTRPQPTPEQIVAYLTTHGWHWSHTIGSVGDMYAYRELFDNGEPATVFVPSHSAWDDYGLRVNSVIDTLAVLERRPWEDVRADLFVASARTATPPNGAVPHPDASTQPVSGSPG